MHKLDDIKIEKLDNGFLVTVSWVTKDADGDNDWHYGKYAFTELEGVLEKVRELIDLL